MKTKKQFLNEIFLIEREVQPICACIDNLYLKKGIPKKDGSIRKLYIPEKELKTLQRKIFIYLSDTKKFPYYVQGGVKGCSIITNAKMHCNKKWVVTLDLKNFFPNVNLNKIAAAIKNNFDFSVDLIDFIVRIVSFKFCIPQGAPSSPFIANLSCWRLDKRIDSLCKMKSLTYSRYFDDITISGDDELCGVFKNNQVDKIIESEGFNVNAGKKRIYSNNENQVVTGLIVNNGLKISDESIEALKSSIENKDHLFSDKQESIIKGKIAFIEGFNKKLSYQLKSMLKKNSDHLLQ